MTQIISNNNWWGWGWSYTAWTWIDISVDKEISIDTDVVQTVGNMVENLDDADNTHYPTAQAVKEAISASWGWDVTWPASSTDWNVVLFDWATWKLIKDSWANLSSKLDASAMSNNNYGWAWQGDSTHTPTKWVLYDKIHTMDVEIGNKAADNTVVKLTWNQTINGTKTFWTSPVVPSKSTDATNTWTAIATEAQVYNVQQDVDAIDDLIPTEATSSNKLADKNYVNDSINSVTAYYITKNAAGDQWATYAELAAATTFYSGWVVRVPTRNDYTIVLADENHDNATTRYIYNSGWEYQYTVNETALTQAQLDALNSGITSWKVSTYDWYATGKQDTLVSWTNIKTINNNSLLGSWDIDVQETLVSWTNIKTINSQDVLWSWNIAINEVPAGWTEWQVLTKTNDWMDWETPAATWVISSNHTYEDMIHLSQAEYDALVSPDPDTFYSTPDDAESWAFEPENTWTEWQVLTKTNTGYIWDDLENWGISKVFVVSSLSSDLSVLQSAYDFYLQGWNPIIKYNWWVYHCVLNNGTLYSTAYCLWYPPEVALNSLKLTVSNWLVTSAAVNGINVTVKEWAPGSWASATNNITFSYWAWTKWVYVWTTKIA